MPWEHVFKDLRARRCASKCSYRNDTNNGTATHNRDSDCRHCSKKKRPLSDELEDVRIERDNFPTQHFAAKERVVVELMSPRRAYEGEIINDQQESANNRSQQETTLNGFAAVIHKG
jgi:hypothetical protein